MYVASDGVVRRGVYVCVYVSGGQSDWVSGSACESVGGRTPSGGEYTSCADRGLWIARGRECRTADITTYGAVTT